MIEFRSQWVKDLRKNNDIKFNKNLNEFKTSRASFIQPDIRLCYMIFHDFHGRIILLCMKPDYHEEVEANKISHLHTWNTYIA